MAGVKHFTMSLYLSRICLIGMSTDNRSRMNTESLQKAFSQVYQEFFSKCSTVVSAPGTFFWSGGMSVMYGGAGIVEKVPLRVYVGIEHDHETSLRFGDNVAYVPHQQQFADFNRHTPHVEQLLKLMNDVRTDFPKKVNGTIHTLSEVPYGAGLNRSGAVNIALTSLIGLESGLVTAELLAALTTAATPDVLSDKSFDRIFRSAWKLEAFAHADVGTGSAPFAAFFESASPFVFCSERRQGTFADHPRTRFPSNVEGHYEILDTIPFSGYRFNDLFKWRGNFSWPVDYGLVYLGMQKNSSVYLKPMRSVKDGLDRVERFVVDNLSVLASTGAGNAVPAFTEMTQAKKQSGYWERSVDFLVMMSAKALYNLKNLLEIGTDESLDELCETVSIEEKIYEFFTKYIPETNDRDILKQVKQALYRKENDDLNQIRLLPDQAEAGGDLLFVAPQGYIQDRLERLTHVLRTEVSPMVRVDHLSWEDGSETGGVRVEQRLASGVSSPFIGQSMVRLAVWKRSSEPTRRMYSAEAFEAAKPEFDLLLDDVDHKLFVRGKLLTSKSIKSAKATIDILKVLLLNHGYEVPAAKFPASAYIERNEMQSKIITPLNTAFQLIAKKRLPFSLHGGLRKNFIVRLSTANLVVGLIERQ